MESIIDEFQNYFCERYPLPRDQAISDRAFAAYEKFCAVLSKEQKELFEQYLDHLYEEEAANEDATYKFAFTTGIKLTLEVLAYRFRKE
ncbi:MAG: hypothetical protein IJ514_02010 [Clostridia bacterium]|nr:hypothetical protein [Clostridia bacterium]